MLTETIISNEVESLFNSSVADNSFTQPGYNTPMPELQVEEHEEVIKEIKKMKNDAENMLEKQLEVAKRMLERTVKQKNKYKNDLDVCRNDNRLLKMQLEAMKKRIDEMNRINSTFVTNVSTAYR